MDANHFDDLLRSLASRTSRRALTALAVGGPLAALLGAADLEAKKRKKKRKKKKKPTCTDGRRNGSESDVDCGGACPRCANGKTCTGRDDCEGAFCANNTCMECALGQACGEDEQGQCICEPTVGGPKTCNQGGEPIEAESCEECPVGTYCIAEGGNASCVKPCGAP